MTPPPRSAVDSVSVVYSELSVGVGSAKKLDDPSLSKRMTAEVSRFGEPPWPVRTCTPRVPPLSACQPNSMPTVWVSRMAISHRSAAALKMSTRLPVPASVGAAEATPRPPENEPPEANERPGDGEGGRRPAGTNESHDRQGGRKETLCSCLVLHVCVVVFASQLPDLAEEIRGGRGIGNGVGVELQLFRGTDDAERDVARIVGLRAGPGLLDAAEEGGPTSAGIRPRRVSSGEATHS